MDVMPRGLLPGSLILVLTVLGCNESSQPIKAKSFQNQILSGSFSVLRYDCEGGEASDEIRAINTKLSEKSLVHTIQVLSNSTILQFNDESADSRCILSSSYPLEIDSDNAIINLRQAFVEVRAEDATDPCNKESRPFWSPFLIQSREASPQTIEFKSTYMLSSADHQMELTDIKSSGGVYCSGDGRLVIRLAANTQL